MTNNTKTIIGVGVGVLLLLWLRNRNRSQSENILKGAGADDALNDGTGGTGVASGGGGGGLGGAIGGILGGGGGGGVAPSPVVINNPTINTLRPMPVAQSQVSPRPYTSPANTRPYTSSVSRPYTSPIDLRPATSPVSLRPETSPNTTQAVSQAPMRSNFLTFDGSFRSPSSLDFDGAIID